jgi:hypothetical protein
MNNKVFLAMFNSMIHESSFGVISVHKTRRGAEMVVEFHKEEMRKEHEKFIKDRDKQNTFNYGAFDQFLAWEVFEMELLD